MRNKSVAFIYPYSFQYRAPFNERVRQILGERGVDYDVIYSSDPRMARPSGDLVSLPWASDVGCRLLKIGGKQLRYQQALSKALSKDLVVLQQENGLLVNYALQMAAPFLRLKTAFFGHGKNFQAERPDSLSERFKKYWINKVDWWFAYTQLSANVVAEAGFPQEKITVFNNAIDTSAIRAQRNDIGAEELANKRQELVDGSPNVGVYVGGLYPLKRIDFLIDAATRIRSKVPDFHLLIIGGGSRCADSRSGSGRTPVDPLSWPQIRSRKIAAGQPRQSVSDARRCRIGRPRFICLRDPDGGDRSGPARSGNRLLDRQRKRNCRQRKQRSDGLCKPGG